VAGPRSSRRCNDELRTSYQNLLKEGGGSKQDRFRARAWLAKDKAKQKQSNSHLAKVRRSRQKKTQQAKKAHGRTSFGDLGHVLAALLLARLALAGLVEQTWAKLTPRLEAALRFTRTHLSVKLGEKSAEAYKLLASTALPRRAAIVAAVEYGRNSGKAKDMVEALLQPGCPRDAMDKLFPNLRKVSTTQNVDALSVTSLHVASYMENVLWILKKDVDLEEGKLIGSKTVLRCTRVCSAARLLVPHVTIWLKHLGCLDPEAHGELVAHAKGHLGTNSREFFAGEARFGTAESLAEAAADPMNLIIWACQALIVLGNAALLTDEDLPLTEKPKGWSHWRWTTAGRASKGPEKLAPPEEGPRGDEALAESDDSAEG
ncbi:unnamed protein product, partial [Prorocentrum cordatum]